MPLPPFVPFRSALPTSCPPSLPLAAGDHSLPQKCSFTASPPPKNALSPAPPRMVVHRLAAPQNALSQAPRTQKCSFTGSPPPKMLFHSLPAPKNALSQPPARTPGKRVFATPKHLEQKRFEKSQTPFLEERLRNAVEFFGRSL